MLELAARKIFTNRPWVCSWSNNSLWRCCFHTVWANNQCALFHKPPPELLYETSSNSIVTAKYNQNNTPAIENCEQHL